MNAAFFYLLDYQCKKRKVVAFENYKIKFLYE